MRSARAAVASIAFASALLTSFASANGQRSEPTTRWARGRPVEISVVSLAPLPSSALAVRTGSGWRTFWRAEAAPTRWSAPDTAIATALHWQGSAPGVESAELQLAGSGEAWRTRVIVVRLDLTRVRLVLETAYGDGRASWTLDRAPDSALFAVNGGQFVSTMPWGWVVLDGRQQLSPGSGPLVSTIAVDGAGRVRWAHGGRVDSTLRRSARWAFQSYPTLLANGEVPRPLRGAGTGLDVTHRDARLAIGSLPDGRLLVAMTRFDALGGALGFVPFGLTTPEMAALLGALGAREAVLLDGGISAQLLVRGSDGRERRFPGLRPVPLALVAMPRDESRRQR